MRTLLTGAACVLVVAFVAACGSTGDPPPTDGALPPDAASALDAAGATDARPDLDAAPSDAGAAVDPSAPRFDEAGSYETTIAGSGDPATVYHPSPADLASGTYLFPVAVLLQGAKVARGYYAGYARLVARYGFVVVVPDHESVSLMGSGLYAEPQVLEQVRAHMEAENQGDGPLAGAMDPGTLLVLGHSYGGAAGLYALQDVCQFPFCSGSFERPAALAGGAFYGTNLRSPLGGAIAPVENDGLPVALLQGSLDGKATAADGQATFDQIQQPPRLFVTLLGANHYGLCDQDNPPGADADSSAPTLSSSVSVETLARWSALFLRATVLGDEGAAGVLASPDPDPNVTIDWQP